MCATRGLAKSFRWIDPELAMLSLDSQPIAILPARGGSKRVPRKNIADVNGHPLLSYAVNACLNSGLFERVIVSTEDSEISDIAHRYGAEIDTRPDALAGDRIPATQVVKELLERNYPDSGWPDHFCLVYPVAAFLQPSDLVDSLPALSGSDGVMGVSRYAIHPYKALVEKDGHLQALWPELNIQQSQNFPETYASNGTFCWMRTRAFLDCMSFYPEKLCAHVIPEERAVDIDTLDDLEKARKMMASRQA